MRFEPGEFGGTVYAVPQLTGRRGWGQGAPIIVAAAAPATHLQFFVQPTDTVGGNPFNPVIVVHVLDAGNNVVLTYGGNVTLAINTGTDTLTGVVTVAAVAGVATFTGVGINKT